MLSRRLRKSHYSGSVMLACSVALSILLGSVMHAQNGGKTETPGRKLLYKVDPDYPWDLKRAHIGGVVRMNVVVTRRGTIDSVSVTGGNPVLVETAVRAVKKWKYAPADSETIIHVNVNFNPDR